MNGKTAIVGALGLLLGAAGGITWGASIAKDRDYWHAHYDKLKERYKVALQLSLKEIDAQRASIQSHLENEQALEINIKELKARLDQLEAK